MARVRVMYWKEIPVQVQAQDSTGQVSQPLDPRFQHAVDAIAMFDGSAGSDAYLEGWGFGPFREVPGTAKEAAAAIAAIYNEKFPGDLPARIRDAEREGRRNPSPGALDHWLELPPK